MAGESWGGRRLPTSNDVAREAGVSQSTVSYVMSGKRSISPSTRRKVEQAMRRLGYQPNSRARALASNRTQVLGIVVPFRPEMDMAVIMQFIGAIATAARVRAHDVLLLTADEGPEGLRRLHGTSLCDAIIIMDVEADDPRIPVARGLDVPVVLIGVPDDHAGLPCVDLDFEAAGNLALTELADLGHRRIGLVAPSTEDLRRDTNFVRRFWRGVDGAARARGVEIRTVSSSSDFRSAEAAVTRLYAELPDLTGLIVHNSDAAEPVATALTARGCRPGRDVALLAVCTDTVAERQPVRLSSVPLEPERVSTIAVEMVLALLDDEQGLAGPETRLVTPRLVRRDSTFPLS